MVPGQAAAGTFRSAGAAESIAQEKWEQLRVQSLWGAPEKSVKRKRETAAASGGGNWRDRKFFRSGQAAGPTTRGKREQSGHRAPPGRWRSHGGS